MTTIRRFRKTHKKHSKKNASYKQLRIHRQPTHIKIYKGGIGEAHGFPQCTTLSQFQITDEALTNFGRVFQSPSDCFINALQLFNIIDGMNANLMRISSAGRTGFEKEQIEIIFIYILRYNFDFKATYDYNQFTIWVQSLLQVGYGVLGGYTGHVFIIARRSDNSLVYIDPQIPVICDVSTCQDTYLSNQRGPWYLLFHSLEQLTVEQEQQVAQYKP